jgi:hypothetical protein
MINKNQNNIYKKYIKYKNKYLNLKNDYSYADLNFDLNLFDNTFNPLKKNDIITYKYLKYKNKYLNLKMFININ